MRIATLSPFSRLIAFILAEMGADPARQHGHRVGLHDDPRGFLDVSEAELLHMRRISVLAGQLRVQGVLWVFMPPKTE